LRDKINEVLLVKALGVDSRVAEAVAPALSSAALKWGIRGTPFAAWLAQCAHESALFTRTEENLNYRASRLPVVWPKKFRLPLTLAEASIDTFEDGRRNPSEYAGRPQRLANFVYAGILGNGDEASGDGWLYRGRGFIQLTGKNNYSSYFEAIGKPQADPEIVSSPHYAADSAAWFWRENSLDHFVRDGDFDGLTRKINGGLHGAKERAAAFDSLKRYFTQDAS
jgi:putative chitinase